MDPGDGTNSYDVIRILMSAAQPLLSEHLNGDAVLKPCSQNVLFQTPRLVAEIQTNAIHLGTKADT